MIKIISATRRSKIDFSKQTALGISLQRLAVDKRITAEITYENTRPLPEVYNRAVFSNMETEIIIICHDDVWLEDYYLSQRVIEGLEHYDIIGVAGNKRRVANAPGWAFEKIFDIDQKLFQWDGEFLSGAVAHGQTPFGLPSYYGVTPAKCELLDGVFLAMKPYVINKIKFDSQFKFHFYDLDFCRQARAAGLTLGTWPICITHQSGGNFGNEEWQEAYKLYLEKWGI